jgi:hypothetical protein
MAIVVMETTVVSRTLTEILAFRTVLGPISRSTLSHHPAYSIRSLTISSLGSLDLDFQLQLSLIVVQADEQWLDGLFAGLYQQ